MKFGFNAITDEAKQWLEKECIRTEQHVATMIDVVAPDNFRVYSIIARDDIKVYYYLFKDKVYWAVNEIKKDYSTDPPTQHVVCILDVVHESVQDSMRERLLSMPEDMDANEGGVLK